ncbi:MAG TPA: glycosyltransferase family 4 protein [Acidimicrobiia bacterium]|jgi:glycosyltransferase involved in cell wall biosynthesis|nr:glycosyltransferase family 4 protein [Acidimicrobiia bacterium]
MRIALVYDTVYPDTKGGVEKRVSELASRLAALGNEVHLLVPLREGTAPTRTAGVTLRKVVRSRPLYTRGGRRAVLPALAHGLGVWRLLRRERFDVVDCQIPAFPSAIAAWLATRGSHTKLVITWHEAWDRDWLDEMGGVLGRFGRLVERLVARLPAVHLAVSPQTAAVVSRIGGPAPEVIPPGVEVGGLAPRNDSGGPADVVFVGRLIPTKNLGLLIEATRRLVSSGLDLSVVVIGDGPAREKWQSQVVERGLTGTIRFLGSIEEWADVMAIVRAAKVLALPSLREGYGMVALEAAALGVPVVTVEHRRNAASHVVEHGVTGLSVPADPGSFADAIRLLLEDEALRSRLGHEARKRARLSDWEAVAETTQDLYAGVV